MTEALRGLPVVEARRLFAEFHAMVTSAPSTPVQDLGKLNALAGVREFPTRIKCASLAWHAVKAALDAAAAEVDGAPPAPVCTE